MLNYLFNLTACWLIFYGLYYFLLRKNTFFHANRLLLLLGLMLGLWVPQVDVTSFFQADTPQMVVNYLQPLQYQLPLIEVMENNQANQFSLSWGTILLWIYVFGVVVVSARFLWGLMQLRHLYQHASLEPKSGYTLVLSQNPHLPFSFFSFLFLSEAISYSAKDEEQIVEHELAHIRGWHSLDILFIELLKIVFWFHPMVYFFQTAIRDVHEYIADEKVLQTNRPKPYGQLLIRQLKSRPHIAFANHFIQSQLKKRIIMMTKSKSSRSKLWRYALVLPLFAFAMMAFSSKSVSVEELAEVATVFSGNGEVDEMPRFPGCEELTGEERSNCATKKLLEFVYRNIKYPAEARKNGIEGTVVVRFVVGKNGKIKTAEVIREIGGNCGKAAMNVINMMNEQDIQWVPGKKDGKAVDVELKIPVKFKLESGHNDQAKKEDNFKDSPDLLEKIHVVGHGNTAPKEIFKVVEEMPRFPGCEDLDSDPKERNQCSQKKLLEFIYKNITYPKSARDAEQEGVVVVKFVVNTVGKLEDVKIVRDPAPALSKEVLRLVYMMNQMDENWIPGRQRGQKVNVEFALPVRFKLDAGGSDQPINKDFYLALENFSVAPNPTSGSFMLKFQGPAVGTKIEISDMSGRPIISKEINNFDGFFEEMMDLSGQSKGIYVVNVLQGEKRYSEVIILQ